jgi:hypothetical protein
MTLASEHADCGQPQCFAETATKISGMTLISAHFMPRAAQQE